MSPSSPQLWHQAKPILFQKNRTRAAMLWLACFALTSAAAEEIMTPVPSVSTQRRFTQPAADEQTLSVSQQFLITGLTREERATVSMTLERWRDQIVRLWPEVTASSPLVPGPNVSAPITPIQVIFQTDASLVPQPRIIQSVETKKFSLQLRLSPLTQIDSPRCQREIVRLLLIERAQRIPFDGPVELGDHYPPDWLTEGFMTAIQIQSDASLLDPWLPETLDSSTSTPNTLMSPEELFASDYTQLLPGQRERYRWSAYAILGVILDLPQSHQWLLNYLRLSATSVAPITSQLKQTFPGLALSNRSLEKWWSLHLAEKKKGRFTEALSYEETETKLAQALTALLPTPSAEEKKQLPALTPIKKKRWRPFTKNKNEITRTVVDLRSLEKITHQKLSLSSETLTTLGASEYREYWIAQSEPALNQLQLRAHPLYRAVIDSYLRLMGLLREGKIEPLQSFWPQVRTEHADTLARLRQVTAHLDWYLATQRREPTGRFDELFDWIQQQSRPQPLLPHSAISHYLDEVDQELKAAKKISESITQPQLNSPASSSAPPSAPKPPTATGPKIRVK